MKLLTFVATLFTASLALACPNLEGSWTCKGSDGKSDVSQIHQKVIPNGVQYSVTANGQTEEVYADGAGRAITRTGMTGTVITKCVEPSGLNHMQHLAATDGSYVADVTLDLTLQNPKVFVTKATVVVTPKGQPAQKNESSSTCTRN